MAYQYSDLRPFVFTEGGQVMFLKIRDQTHRLIGMAGAVTMGEAISGQSGSSWDMLACVDRLVELGEIREVNLSDGVAGQDRIFIGAR